MAAGVSRRDGFREPHSLSFLQLALSQAHPRAAAVLVDELDARRLRARVE